MRDDGSSMGALRILHLQLYHKHLTPAELGQLQFQVPDLETECWISFSISIHICIYLYLFI